MSTTNRTDDPHHPRRARRRWFPVWWILGIAIVVGLLQLSGISPDYRNMGKLVGVIAGLIGVSVWFLFHGIGSPLVRGAVLASAWTVLLLLHRFVIDFRNDGAGGLIGWRWAWQPKADQLLNIPKSNDLISNWQSTSFDYPRFLGNGYWPEATGVEIDPDWQANPPQEVWRRPIGAGWSAFAVVGDYAVTQEQRGDSELVTCYRVSTGEPIWAHSDPVRFDPQDLGGNLGGVGPRATPTIYGDRVYTQGATGIVNCLDAPTGNLVWQHNVEEEWGVPPTLWGKSGSPLVVDELRIVIVNVGAPQDAAARKDYAGSLTAFDLETGEVHWRSGNLVTAYASPVHCELAGERQILQVNEGFLCSYRAVDGKLLWKYDWPSSSSGSAACTQPIPLAGDRVFISKGYGHGSTLLQIERDQNGEFRATPLWTPAPKLILKTKLSNVVVRDGCAYGLDDTLLQCVRIDTGKSMWKKRRTPAFGHGQILLAGDKLLVTTERGELILVECSPDGYRELASMRVLDEEGISWNNPALSGPFLLVRNECEAACFRLPLKGESARHASFD